MRVGKAGVVFLDCCCSRCSRHCAQPSAAAIPIGASRAALRRRGVLVTAIMPHAAASIIVLHLVSVSARPPLRSRLVPVAAMGVGWAAAGVRVLILAVVGVDAAAAAIVTEMAVTVTMTVASGSAECGSSTPSTGTVPASGLATGGSAAAATSAATGRCPCLLVRR